MSRNQTCRRLSPSCLQTAERDAPLIGVSSHFCSYISIMPPGYVGVSLVPVVSCIGAHPMLAALNAPLGHAGHASFAPLHTVAVPTVIVAALITYHDQLTALVVQLAHTLLWSGCLRMRIVFTYMGWHVHLRRRRETNPPTDRIRPVCHQTYVAPYPRISLALISALAPP